MAAVGHCRTYLRCLLLRCLLGNKWMEVTFRAIPWLGTHPLPHNPHLHTWQQAVPIPLCGGAQARRSRWSVGVS